MRHLQTGALSTGAGRTWLPAPGGKAGREGSGPGRGACLAGLRRPAAAALHIAWCFRRCVKPGLPPDMHASHHMKVLHEAGLVDREKRGVWAYYRARPQALAAIGTLIGCTPL